MNTLASTSKDFVKSGRRWWTMVVLGAVLLIVAAAFPFACYVWPTAYRYDSLYMRGTRLPVRIHRITGKTELLHPDGWREAGRKDR